MSKTAKTSKLTQSEKYQIQGMMHNNISIEDIAESLNRTDTVIRNYIDGELEDLYNTVARVQANRTVDLNEDGIAGTPQVVIDKAKKALIERGIKSEDAAELVRRACIQYQEKPFTGSGSLIHVALQQVNTKDLMITKTSAQGRKGVAVMTKEASERADSRRKNMKKLGSRVTRGNIYLIKEDKVI